MVEPGLEHRRRLTVVLRRAEHHDRVGRPRRWSPGPIWPTRSPLRRRPAGRPARRHRGSAAASARNPDDLSRRPVPAPVRRAGSIMPGRRPAGSPPIRRGAGTGDSQPAAERLTGSSGAACTVREWCGRRAAEPAAALALALAIAVVDYFLFAGGCPDGRRPVTRGRSPPATAADRPRRRHGITAAVRGSPHRRAPSAGVAEDAAGGTIGAAGIGDPYYPTPATAATRSIPTT